MIVANAIRLPYRDQSAHMACTSQPYYQKRRYQGIEPLEWPEISYSPMPGLPPIHVPAVTAETITESGDQRAFREWYESGDPLILIVVLGILGSPVLVRVERLPLTPGQLSGILGLEPDPFAYIGHLVLIFREAWRVLRDDGVLCVNTGDSYANDTKWGGYSGGKHAGGMHGRTGAGRTEAKPDTGYPQKCLMGIPWRLAFALVADGWTLRSRMPGGVEMRPDVIWTKNAMPESVRDRPSVDFEDVFIFSKQKRYCWDSMNARVETTGTAHSRGNGDYPKGDPSRGIYKLPREPAPTRNMRASWYITSEATSEEHYAAFPRELVRRLIKIGTSDKGCCPECGAQWVRRVRVSPAMPDPVEGARQQNRCNGAMAGGTERVTLRRQASRQNLGWSPGCSCGENFVEEGVEDPSYLDSVRPPEPVPCRVLDPFSGIGRTGEVCYETGRVYMPAELSVGYVVIQARRLKERRPGLEAERLKAEAAAAGRVLDAGKLAVIGGPLFSPE